MGEETGFFTALEYLLDRLGYGYSRRMTPVPSEARCRMSHWPHRGHSTRGVLGITALQLSPRRINDSNDDKSARLARVICSAKPEAASRYPSL